MVGAYPHHAKKLLNLIRSQEEKFMKKLIALVLALAMMVSVFALSASAATTPALVLTGANEAAQGSTYVLTVTLKGAASVAGIQGTVTADGADVAKVQLNSGLLTANNTQDATSIVKTVDNEVSFKSLVDTTKDSYATIRITYNVTKDAPSFALKDVVASDANATRIDGFTTTDKTTTKPTVEATITAVGMKPEKTADQQGIVVHAVATLENAEEFGVIFYPTTLLNGAALTLDTQGAVVAKVTAENESFAEARDENGAYGATLHFNFSTKEYASQFLGIKVSAVAYCIADGQVYYSTNSVDKYIQGGVASKAVLNVAVDKIQELGNAGTEIPEDVIAAMEDLNGTNYVANRDTVLGFVVDQFTTDEEA